MQVSQIPRYYCYQKPPANFPVSRFQDVNRYSHHAINNSQFASSRIPTPQVRPPVNQFVNNNPAPTPHMRPPVNQFVATTAPAPPVQVNQVQPVTYHAYPMEDNADIPKSVMELSRMPSNSEVPKPCAKRKRNEDDEVDDDEDDEHDDDRANNNFSSVHNKVQQPRSKVRKTEVQRKPLSHPVRASANDRERKRNHDINLAFEELKSSIPTQDGDRLTKEKTLKLAVSYIRFLEFKVFNKNLLVEQNNPKQGTDSTSSQLARIPSASPGTPKKNKKQSILLQNEHHSYEFGLWRVENDYNKGL